MWEQIRSNQIRSGVLTAGMGALLLLLGCFLGLYFLDSGTAGLVIALVVWGIMSLTAYFQGDSILLAVAGARKVSPDSHPRLYNVVEEMKIASGLEAMPDVYIIDDPTPNAFATGRDPRRSAVAVTSGLLQKLNRDELQGVVAHEMSHISNRDVLLMTISGVLLGTIVILAWYASRALFYGGHARSRRSSSSGGGSGQIIVLAVAVVLMILAPIMAQLIYFAISRKREYLADASGALYTRYPEGLASALEKIACSTGELRNANKATAPMYIINPFRGQGATTADLTSTHPPIEDRIRILRSMGGASFADYDRAYRQAHRAGRGIVPPSALAAASAVPLRAAQPQPVQEVEAEVQRARETSDILWHLSNYTTVDCQCGTRLRVPPGFKDNTVRCPHCGRLNPLNRVPSAQRQ